MAFNMVAGHARWPKVNDAIFGLAAKAKEAVEKYGKENVIDSTLGALVDDNGDLICLNTVYQELKSLPNAAIAAYAQVAGQPDFLETVPQICFGKYRPDAYIRAVATPGGTGSVRHAIYNYTEPGDSILISDWFWSPYVTISEEYGRKATTFELFNDKNEFNLASFKEKFEELLNRQKRLVTILNTPANNPTGYSLSDEEWDEVLNIAKENAEDPEKRIIIVVDCAYIDYAGIGDERRKFFAKFSGLPKNILIIVAFSMSKGYTMYGMRSGAAIGISSDEEIAEEFFYSCLHSNRANWSNGTRAAMEIMTRIAKDPEKTKAYEAEVNETKMMLRRRADAFVKAAQEVGLEILPYRDGFFVSIPCKDAKKASDELIKENMFVVALKKGLRFAVCGVSEEKCRIAPAIIKSVLDRME
ncbi:MAG TPA: aminotransferase class I/II-fold pyridoxal phosphate-dependent enzyme [Sedimentibacter sp.]|jgi:aromatic-amino-acid transaminase|nr:aminotransferase class I/II-fold pyridoxal phosphate-dependent enzyme [Sedimentibacter sp.]HRC80623.1 aminotransferase class I/II-fold pyridoxal phosphate-dependent enzyme [Sedimentibacter sp.]